jgi:hypothetical protein
MRNLLIALLIAGCSSGPEAKSPEPAPEPAPEPTAGPAEPAEPADPAEPTAMTLEEKKALAGQVVAMFDEVGAAITANEADCAAMATEIDGIATRHADLIAKGKTIDDDPEFKTWFDETHGEHIRTTMGAAVQSMMKNCAEDEGVKAAFQRLAGE